MPQHSSSDFLMPSPISSKYLGMYSNVWVIVKCLNHSKAFMGIQQEAGDTQYIPEQGSISLFRADELSSTVLTITVAHHLFVLSVLVVLHPLFPDLLSNLLWVLGGELSSMGINRLLVLWASLEASRGHTKKMRQTEERQAAFSSQCCGLKGLPPPFTVCQPTPWPPKGFSNTGLPAAIAGLGDPHSPLLLAPGQSAFLSWCLKPCS